MTREATAQRLADIGGVAVVRAKDPAHVAPIAEALIDGGVPAIEVTMTVPGALDVISSLGERYGDDILLGVGSVLDAATCERAVNAGARFVASPIFESAVAEIARQLGAATMPGAFTPTEALRVQNSGADFVKVFPADVLGLAFVRGILAPMPHLRVIPTGGVTPENAGDWIRAGCRAVGLGSALVDKDAVASGDWAVIRDKAATLRRSIDDARAAP